MSRTAVCLAFACLASLTGPAASTGLFPKLRKKLEAERKLSLSQNATAAEPVEPVEVPPPMDVGSDGFPVLPAVDQMLGGAAVTLKTVSSQASDIAGRMAAAQKQSESELSKQKNAFEQNLKTQEEKNQAVASENSKISDEIDTLKKQNVDLRKEAHDIQKKNVVLRSAVKSLGTEMGTAKEFAHKSMVETDDSKKEVLSVLQVHHKDDNDDDNKDDDDKDDYDKPDDTDDDPTLNGDDDEEDQEEVLEDRKVPESVDEVKDSISFLALSSKVENAAVKDSAAVDAEAADLSLEVAGLSQQASMVDNLDADGALQALSKDIGTLMAQRKQSVTNLKNLFIRDFRAGAKRGLALLSQQKQLIAHRTELMSIQSKLKDAVAHLEGTHKQLGRRLHGLGQFLQKLAHVANAPETEVPHMLESLPKAVIVAPKAAV